MTIRRGGIDIAIPARSHLNVRTVSDVHRSDPHTRVLQRNLARGVDELFPSARDEIEAALRREAAGYRTWTPERVNSLAVRVVVRTLASKCCVLPSSGSSSIERSELAVLEDELHLQMGCVAKVLHLFPVTLTAFAARDLLPSNWRMYSNLSVAERLIAMVIDEERRGTTPPSLPLIADSATPSDSQTSLVFKETLAITAAWTQNSPVEEVEDEDEEDETMGLPSPPGGQAVKFKAAGRKRKRGPGEKGRKPKVKKIKLRIKNKIDPPCCLCPNDITSMELLPTTDGRKAHRICALYLPETYIEAVDGKDTVHNISGVHKDRMDLKCLYCRSKRGGCFQCSQKMRPCLPSILRCRRGSIRRRRRGPSVWRGRD